MNFGGLFTPQVASTGPAQAWSPTFPGREIGERLRVCHQRPSFERGGAKSLTFDGGSAKPLWKG